MNIKHHEAEAEKEYLENTLSYIRERLRREHQEANSKEEDLIAFRREMYENTSHHSQDFNKLTETMQYLDPLVMQTMDFEATQQRVALYQKMEKAPYFARVDFNTTKWGTDTVYIGIGNLEDEDSFESYVYDWRAPIASIFYRFELGKASYKAPSGTIEGEITLKRQFEIKDSQLKFFFDSSVNIVDEILKEALSNNTSPKMRTIVETIQREQDLIIRDIENDLVIVQGVAGSGKTSIALHRAAYLMYQGLTGHLNANNMILISPNTVFAQYISEVLPELGEKNIEAVTFERLFRKIHKEELLFKKRNAVLEEIMTAPPVQRELLQDNLTFKSSPQFLTLLNRLIHWFERRMIPFADVEYDGQIIAQKELLKARFLESGSRGLPVQVRLQHIEQIITDKLKERRPYRMKKLENYMSAKPERMLDFKTAARLLNSKHVSNIMSHVRKFTRIDYRQLYTQLFSDDLLFTRLSAGLELPDNIEEIIALTLSHLESGTLDNSDAMALFLLRLRMDASHADIDMRQVVVDEAQDYSPVHFEILARLYPNAKYTVLGDINQTIVSTNTVGLFRSVEQALGKRKSTTVTLNKSFRCSYEISTFSSQFSDKEIEIQQLNRFEEIPTLCRNQNDDKLVESLLAKLAHWKGEGYKTIAIVCKSAAESAQLFAKLYGRWDAKLFADEETVSITGTMVLPVYLAKGLEFDAVAVYNTDKAHYYTDDDRRLLYVSATRALHRLALFYTGELSPLITPPEQLFLAEPLPLTQGAFSTSEEPYRESY